jgi:hypothetical protein
LISLNIFGYFLSPVLSGAVMQWSGGIQWGFRLCLWWGFISLFGSVMLFRAARTRESQSQLRRSMAKIKSFVCPPVSRSFALSLPLLLTLLCCSLLHSQQMRPVPEDAKLPQSQPQPISQFDLNTETEMGRLNASNGRTLLHQLSRESAARTAVSPSAVEPPVSVTVIASAGDEDGLEVR